MARPFCWLALVLVACGDPAVRDDAGAEAGAAPDAAMLVIAPPALPAAPVLTPCPPGWREVTGGDGAVTCDPWPVSGYRDDCAFDEAHFPGTPGCARLGTACAADGWPSDLPTGASVVYVDDGAAPGGDGSTRALAFQTIGAAAAVALSGAIIAVATGHYDEPQITVHAHRTLWGACVAGTRLTSSTYVSPDGVVLLAGSGAGARNLGIDAPAIKGVVLAAGNVTLRDVAVAGAVEFGIVGRSGSAAMTNVVVRDGHPPPSGVLGAGLLVENGASVVADHLVLERNPAVAATVGDAGSHLELADCAIESTRVDASTGIFGRGIDLEDGTSLLAMRVVLEHDHDIALEAYGIGTTAHVEDLVVRDTLPRDDGLNGVAFDGSNGSAVTIARAWLEANHEAAVFVNAAALELDDAVVRGTLPDLSTHPTGHAIDVTLGGSLVLSRAMLSGNTEVALLARGAGVTVTAADVVARDTAPVASDGSGGRGIDVEDGATLTLGRGLLDHDREVALFASGTGAAIHATDLTVRDTQPSGAGDPSGVGLWAQRGASIEVATARVERSLFVGALAVNGASIRLEDVVISGVGSSACAASTCPAYAGGFGVSAHFGATVTATRFAVEDTALCGVVVGMSVAAPTAVDLANGVIARTPVGACVQVDGYDSARLRNDVQYVSVGVPLQATSYALPDELAAP